VNDYDAKRQRNNVVTQLTRIADALERAHPPPPDPTTRALFDRMRAEADKNQRQGAGTNMGDT